MPIALRASSLSPLSMTRWVAVTAVLGLVLVAAAPVQAQAGTAIPGANPKPGAWTQLGPAQNGAAATLLHLKSGKDMVAWQPPVVHGVYRYDYVELNPNGGMAGQPKDVFGGSDWGGVTATPVLVSEKGSPVLVFEGAKGSSGIYSYGCIVGDQFGPSGWTLQTWTLSASCVNPDHFGAAALPDGTISAAWPGLWSTGNGIRYRIGVSPTIPAKTPDKQIPTNVGDAGSVSEATDPKSHNIWAAWTRFFSKPSSKDGLWAANLSSGKPKPVKAPDTGSNLVASYPQPVAIASPSGRDTVYMAYCNNTSPCSKVELWKVGASKPVTVPGSKAPRSVALSAGPAGRLWISWWSPQSGTVRVVRTNKAGTAFGPVESYAGPSGCTTDNIATISNSSGEQQRLDVVLGCINFNASKLLNREYATQSIVPLQLATTAGYINHKKGGTVVYRVSDVGDPVVGALVAVDGKKATTDKKGQVTFHIPKGAKTGAFAVKATATDYLPVSGTLVIT